MPPRQIWRSRHVPSAPIGKSATAAKVQKNAQKSQSKIPTAKIPKLKTGKLKSQILKNPNVVIPKNQKPESQNLKFQIPKIKIHIRNLKPSRYKIPNTE